MITVGTSGFSYKDWVGPVYAPGTKSRDMLAAYAELFPAVEINTSYYGVPAVATVSAWARTTPGDFRFTAKLPGTATHLPAAAFGTIHDDVRLFRVNLQPLVDAGKLACALMQFPNAFRPSDAAVAHVRALHAALGDMPLVAEFRHREWQSDATLVLLRELGIGLAAVDEPQYRSLPRPMTDATSGIAYVRFHGRNYEQWWKGDNVTRYDYLYAAEELGPWADRIVDLASHDDVKEVLAFFNNHRRGQAARNAKMFEAMLATRFPRELVRRHVNLPVELPGIDNEPLAGPPTADGDGSLAPPQPLR